MLIIPFISSLTLIWIAFIVIGFFGPLAPLAANAWILQIWKEKSNPVMQGLHFGFSLSMTISPLIVAPYLSAKPEKHENITRAEWMSKESIAMRSTGEDGHLPSLFIPYLFPAALYFICSAAYVFVYFDKRYSQTGESDKTSARKMSKVSRADEAEDCPDTAQSPNSTNSRNSLIVIVLAISVTVFNQANECNTMNFTAPFVSFLLGDKQKGAQAASLLAGSNAVGRLISVVTARYFAPQFMVMGHLLVILMGNVLLLMFAESWHTIIPIAFVLIGAGQSSVLPSLLSLFNQKIHMTNQLLSIILVADMVALIFAPLVVSPLLESFPLIFPIFDIIVLLACYATFFLFFVKTRNMQISKTGENNNNNGIHLRH